MQNNKILKEFLEHEYNQDANYKAIVSKTERKPSMKKKILSVAAVILVVIVVGVTVPTVRAKIAWNTEFAEYQNRDRVEGTGAINEAIKDGYEENINMEYIYKDNIGIKVDSLMISNDCFRMQVNIKFDKDTNVDKRTFNYGVAIYDENNNVYAISERTHWGAKEQGKSYYKKFYQETGIKYNKKDVVGNELASSRSSGIISMTPRNIIAGIEMSSNKGFPKSKKLYIRIFDIGYSSIEVDAENKKVTPKEEVSLTDVEWDFEIDVPEKFYERETTELKLAEEIKGVKINKAEISETGLILNLKIDGIRKILMDGKDMDSEEFKNIRDNTVYVSEGDGTNHIPIEMRTAEGDNVEMKFNISKKHLEGKLYLNVNIKGESYKVELIKK